MTLRTLGAPRLADQSTRRSASIPELAAASVSRPPPTRIEPTYTCAEGVKQSQILTAEGEKQSAILKAEGQREAQALKAEGESKAIETVFKAIHEGNADQKLLAYQYLQMLPQIAQGDSNKVWIIPSEFTEALGQLRVAIGSADSRALPEGEPPKREG